ncbi:MAG: phage tail tape measure protein, partial [Sutterella sp.]
DKLVRLKKEVGESAKAYTQAKQKIADAGQAYSKSAQRTKELTREHAAAKREVAKLEQAAAEAGTTAKDMAQKYGAACDKAERLGREHADAKREVAKLEQAAAESGTTTKEMAQQYGAACEKADRLGKEHADAKREVAKLEQAAAEAGTTTKEMAQKFGAASEKADRLGKELADSKRETDGLATEMKQAKTALDKTKGSLDRKRESLEKYEQSVGEVDSDLKSLIARQKELAEATDKARAAQERMNKINAKISKAQSLQDKLGNMKSSSMGALTGLAASAAPVVMTVKAAMDFEDARAELAKFSDDAESIFSGIRDLTKRYSKSAADMTAMATNAMQSGIAKTKEDVLTLVESQTQAAVAFDMTGDAVGQAWADIQSKMNLGVKETQEVFDIINTLGNETSAASADIIEVLQRQGGAVKSLTALSEKQVAALAGAFRSASTSSEVAATSLGAFIGKLTAGSTATKAQKEAFEALGLDAKKVAKAMSESGESAEKTIQTVFQQIGKLGKDEQGAVITQLFGTESGIKSAVATLSSNTQMLTNNLETAGNKARYTGSMYKEFAARANTTSEALGIARNSVTDLGASIGDALLPNVKTGVQSFIDMSTGLSEFISNNQSLVATVLQTTGVIGGAVAAFHALRFAFAFIVSPIVSVYHGYQNLRKGIELVRQSTILSTISTKAHAVAMKAAAAAQTIWTAAKNGTLGALIREKAALIASKIVMAAHTVSTYAAAAAQWALNSAFLACPVTWIVLGILALVAAGVLLYQNWEQVKATASSLWTTVKEKASSAWESLKSILGKIGDFFKETFDKVKAKCMELWATFQERFPMLSRIVQMATLPIQIAIQAVIIIFKLLKAGAIALWNGIKWAWKGIKSATVSAWNSVTDKVRSVWNKFKEFGSYIWGKFKSSFVDAFQGIRDKISSVFSGLVGIVKGPMNSVISLVNKAIGHINGISVTIPEWAGGGTIGFNIPKIPKLAAGGVVTQPTLAMIGEGREAEAVMPLSKLESMTDAGEGERVVNVTYSPVINISGGSGENVYEQASRALRESLADFERKYERMLSERRRYSYA